MSSVLGSESRGRNRFIETSIERFQQTLAVPTVNRRLGAAARRLYELSENYYVPNVSHGEVLIPDTHVESDQLPIIALHSWNTVRLDPKFAIFTPGRRATALQIVKRWNPSGEDSESWLNGYQDSIYRHAQRTEAKRDIRRSAAMQAARASNASLDNGELTNASGTVSFEPRPLLILRRQHQAISPPIFGHELFHVVQGDIQPIRISDVSSESSKLRNIRTELEAYHVGGVIAATMLEVGQDITVDDRLGLNVEYVRRQVNGNLADPFDPTPELVSELEARGILKDLI